MSDVHGHTLEMISQLRKSSDKRYFVEVEYGSKDSRKFLLWPRWLDNCN